MRDYLKSIALLAALFGLLTAGTLATARTEQTLDLARATARSFCGHAAPGIVAAACRGIARLRSPRTARPVMRS